MSPDTQFEREPDPMATPPEQPEQLEQDTIETDRPGIIEDNSSQAVATELNRVLRDSQETQADIRLLAQSMDFTRHLSEENSILGEARFSANLEDVLKRFVSDENKRKEVAAEIIEFEKTLVAQFRGQIETRTAPEQKEQVAQTIAAVRESLYGIVINGLLPGKKIRDIISSINYSKIPDGEVTAGGSFSPNDFCAYYSVQQDDRIGIYIYEKFLDDRNKVYITKHEFAHAFAEAGNLWQDDTYNLFLRCAGNLNPEDINALITKAPELAEVLEALKDPDSHAGLWNKYIQKRLGGLKNLTGKALAKERIAAAREVVAEMIAPYLESGQSAEGYLSSKLQFTSEEELHAFLLNTSGCQNDVELQAFCQSRGVNMEQLATGEDILREFSKIDEFRSFFRLCDLFKAKLDRDLGSIQRKSFFTQDRKQDDDNIYKIFDDDDFDYGADDFGITSFPFGEQLSSDGSAPKQKTFIDKFFDWLVPKKSKNTMPAPQKPA